MLTLFIFFLGLFLLFKGGFRMGSRTISQTQSRPIAFYLMAPLLLELCLGTLLLPNYLQVTADGAFGIDFDSFMSIANTLAIVEFVAVGIAIMLSLYTIFSIPPNTSGAGPVRRPSSVSASTPAQPATPPNIMTVAEAAAYMRVSESDVLSLIEQGKLGAARIGDTYRIARIAIEDFLGRS